MNIGNLVGNTQQLRPHHAGYSAQIMLFDHKNINGEKKAYIQKVEVDLNKFDARTIFVGVFLVLNAIKLYSIRNLNKSAFYLTSHKFTCYIRRGSSVE